MRRAPALIVLAAMLAARSARADTGDQERVIRYDRDTLTVRLAKAPVTDVLDEIGRQAGAEIRGQVRTPRDVSVEFDAVPISDALHRLLGDQNFALVYGHEGQLKSVRLLGGPQTGPATVTLVGKPASPTTTEPESTSVVDLLAKHGAIPVTGHLGDALGGQQATLFQLIDLGTHHADPTVRAEATRALMAAVDTDPALRVSLIVQMSTMDDAALADFVRNAAGDHAEEVTMQVLNSARAAQIRAKASAVLQQLRGGG
jgi:hypothetical protein